MPTTFEMFRKPIVRQLTLENGQQQIICRIFPVTADNSMIYGYVVVWETAKTLDGFDNIVLEHIAVNVAVERVLAREKDEAKARVKRDFYFDLITGNIESIHAIKSMAAFHGFPVDSGYRCISVQFLMKYDLITPDFTKLSSEIAERISRMCDVFVSCVSVSDGMIILYSTHESGEQEIDTLHTFINRFKDEFAAKMQAEVRIVVSELVEDITKISNAYKCVCRLHELKYGIPSADVLFVEDYPVHFLIGDNVDSLTIKNFVQKSIGVLIEHDKKYNVNLVETMNTYFLCGRNISETAKKMFIHRNTCIYRIDKIKCLLDDDFSDSNSLLKYQIALICLSLMDSENY